MSQPTYSSAVGYISEQFFTISFDVALDAAHPPLISAFDVQVNGTGVTVTGVSIDSAAKTVTLTLGGSTLLPGDIVDFVYTDPSGANDTNAIQGTDGADAASFSHSIVVAIGRPGPAAPAAPALDAASDTGVVGDGITSIATPTVSGTAAANATVKLYDTDGATLLGSTTANASGAWTITSSVLGNGAHALRVTQTDGSNATSPLSTGLNVTIDTSTAAPTSLALAAGSDSGTLGDGIGNRSTPTITGQAEANASVRLYDTDGTTVLGNATANGSGVWSITSSSLTEGTHTLSAIQTDVAGNVSAASGGFSYTLDTVGPTGMALSTTSVAMSAATSGASIATLSATDQTAVTYGFEVGNGVIDADNGKFGISGNTLAAMQNLTAGTYHIYLSATDAAGNQSYQIFSIDVTDAPSVSSIVRAGGGASTVAASAASVDYVVTFSQDVTGVDAGDFVLTASGNASGAIASVTGSGSVYTVTVDTLTGDGNLRLDLKSSGTGIQNTGGTAIGAGYTGGQTFALDHTAPAAPGGLGMHAADDSGVSSADGVTSVATPHISGTAEANATVRLYDTDGVTVLGSTTANGSGGWTIVSSTLAAGGHTLTARQTDAAGNESAASAGLLVRIDTGAAAPAQPVLAAASDTGRAGDGITNVATPTITGSAEAFASVRLYDTGGSTLLGTTIADAAGAWSIMSSTLAQGAHALSVRQTDQAGNVSAASTVLNLTIDSVAPVAPAAPRLDPASDSGAVGDGITDVSRPVLTGNAEAGAAITVYDTDGVTVLGTTQADGSGNWSLVSSTLARGAHALRVTQTDAAGNTSAHGAVLDLTIVARPAPLVDGVAVTQQPVALPGGGSGTRVNVPIVTAGRVESSGAAGVADIPLASSAGTALLTAQVGVGLGLAAAGGASRPAGDSLETLVAAITAATPGHTALDQGHLTGNGQAFLDLLPSQVPLLVQTVTPMAAAQTSGATLTLVGTSSATQHTALVIDARGIGAGNTLDLKSVDFAAVIGAAAVTGTTTGQVLSGDAAAQSFMVGAAQASTVFAGGGNDVLQLAPAANASMLAVAAAESTTMLHGGLGGDKAVFAGAIANYTIERHDGHLIVTANGTQDRIAVVNVEMLQFADTSVAVQNRDALSAVAGLYQTALGRQADLGGFEFWANAEAKGYTLGEIAVRLIDSAEGRAVQQTFNGDAAHDIAILYSGIFGRVQDAGGAAFWQNAMQQGVSLTEVADAFLHSAEIVGLKLAAGEWDFSV